MSPSRLGAFAAVAALDTALLLGVGFAMWSEAPSPAEEAVGKGLVAVGAAVGVAAFALLCAWLTALGYGIYPETQVRGDREDA
ncbi:hypothetical protein GCM10023350_01140 [Nocardioides endophyticus]|uniref:Uncharacterized protein n=1 Tax=Nocardioides endophyticus TaxID=1353775 RepID=A0ABP8Y6T0_9ACTN